MKKAISLILALMLCVSLAAVPALGDETKYLLSRATKTAPFENSVTVYEYDDKWNLIKETLSTNLRGGSYLVPDDIVETTEYEYNDAGELTKEIYSSSDGGAATHEYAYEYDGAGNLIKEVDNIITAHITYTKEYEYDAAGNLTKETFSEMTGNNQITEYEYDAAGNLTKETSSYLEYSQTITYEYILLQIPDPAAPAVEATAQAVTVNGGPVTTEAYNIDGYNYFKLRDLAYMLNGTGSQFSVGYDGETATISVTTSEAYAPVGGEMAAGTDNSNTCVESAQSLLVNGVPVSLTAYNIGGYNFFKLRELGDALGFGVDFDEAANTAVITSR